METTRQIRVKRSDYKPVDNTSKPVDNTSKVSPWLWLCCNDCFKLFVCFEWCNGRSV